MSEEEEIERSVAIAHKHLADSGTVRIRMEIDVSEEEYFASLHAVCCNLGLDPEMADDPGFGGGRKREIMMMASVRILRKAANGINFEEIE